MKTRTSTAARALAALAPLILIGLTLTWQAAPAAAHSELVSSTPVDGASLRAMPAEVELQFNQDIAAQFATVTLTALGTQTDPITLDPAVSGARVTADVPNELDRARSWRLAYRVTSADGHPIEGAVDFDVPSDDPSVEERPQTDQTDAGATPPREHQSGPDTSDTRDSPWSSTVMIGLIAAAGTAAAIVLLRRAAREE
ncbi:copper resistance CopC family protein [Nocardioides sp. TF02-7]|uniref:copper resistance CopC family protein n=1 Tax=Nocardioides sp. TF02-7 TaxID=2917724 RepID=UPI001F050E16|nr:copper resistance CopC family protein [Nocardioides sp. TF02-7]UMG92243.1 copper resistance protein CopC [Nocardioides sp. TF02-7]